MDVAQVGALASELETTLGLLSELIRELQRTREAAPASGRLHELVARLASRPDLAELPTVLLRAHAEITEIVGGTAETGESPAPIELPEAPAPEIGARLHSILLVDDEAGIRRSVSRFLRRSGFQVTEVPDGEAALQALGAASHDVVISDLRMPGLSGEELFARIQRDFPAMTGRIIFTSGDTVREETRRFLTGSGCPSLQKPYGLSELVKVLRTLCPADGRAVEARRAST